jgi:adenylate kinase
VKRRIVLLGPPASGKGTLADALQVRLALPVASVGAMLRAEKAAGTPLGLEVSRLTQGGQLLDDTLINPLLESWLTHQGAAGFIFDGYPRTLGQAATLDDVLATRGTPLDAALWLEASEATLRSRVESRVTCSQCGYIVSVGLHIADASGKCPRCGGSWSRREDDNAETLGHRLREYREKTEPVAAYYESREILHRIQSERSPEQVLEAACQILNG